MLTLLLACKGNDPVAPTLSPVSITPPTSVTTAPAVRTLVWSDEFDKAGLPDPAKWKYDVGGSGWGNNELQFYTDKRAENARVEDGKLIIEARKEDVQNNRYSSARLLTAGRQSWKYGRIEAFAKLPKGRGTWPAIWMLGDNISAAGWPRCGELDIMEHVGYDQGVVHGTAHTEAYNHVKGTQKEGKTNVDSVEDKFHLYAIEWTGTQINFSVDDNRYYTVDRSILGGTEAEWPFDQPFFLILNLAVGGNWGGLKGVDESIWPQRMEVDYVRVYQ